MKQPEVPHNEAQRLDALHSLEILDTATEERFDRITRLARRLFNVPIAVVSLVDSDRQWFKSCLGLPVRETGRDVSFCGHCILGDDVFIVENACQDERFADNPLVLNEPHIRFYAGVPLKHTNGHKLGTLCIIDTMPRKLSEEDISDLKELAVMTERELASLEKATLDELTQLSNRRGMHLFGNKALKHCLRSGVEATLAVLNLKEAANSECGDEIISQFARYMQKESSDVDVIARIDRSHFAVLMLESSFDDAQMIVQRLQQLLQKKEVLLACKGKLRFSAKYVEVKGERTEEVTMESLLEKALNEETPLNAVASY